MPAFRPARRSAAFRFALVAAIASVTAPAVARERADSSLGSGAAPERGARVIGTRAVDDASRAALLDALAKQADLNRAVELAARPTGTSGLPVIVAPGPYHALPHYALPHHALPHHVPPHAAGGPHCPGCVVPGPRVPKAPR